MEDMKCPYEEECKERFEDVEWNEHRSKCDCINCAFCDYYWIIYDDRSMKRINKGGRGDGIN